MRAPEIRSSAVITEGLAPLTGSNRGRAGSWHRLAGLGDARRTLSEEYTKIKRGDVCVDPHTAELRITSDRHMDPGHSVCRGATFPTVRSTQPG